MSEAESKKDDFGREEHDALKKEVKSYSENMEDKYDEKIKNLGKVEEDDRDFSDLETKYNDLKKEVTELRKNGKDVFYAHNLLLGFPTKLEIAKATEDPKDLKKAEDVLYEAEKDIHDAKKQELVDVRKEVEERFKQKIGEEENQKEVEEGTEKVKTSKIDIYEEPEDPEKWFHLYNGEDLKSIAHLMDYLPDMPEEMFQYYIVSSGENDFARWIESVFGAKELADKIRDVKDKNKVVEIMKKEVSEE